MRRASGSLRAGACFVWLASLLLSTALAGAEESGEPTPPDESDRAAELAAAAGPEGTRQLLWSTTFFGQLKGIHSSQDDDGLGGFFDQYEFTPNKDNSVALELGVREAAFDWIEEGGALLQLRYESPTSNLGVTGSDLAQLVAFGATLGPEDLHPEPLVRSEDLARVGIPRGPRWGELLAQAEELQLEGLHTSREQALAWLRGQT